MAPGIITTERLTLRRAREDDLEALYAVFSNPDAMRYWDTLPHEDREQTRRFMSRMIEASETKSDDFVVEHQGHVIGKAGFWRRPEVGYILHPDHWGKGFAREALTALIARAFNYHCWPHITAEIDPRNDRSRNLLTGLGFTETGFAEKTLKLGDLWVDSAYFRLDNPSDATGA